MFCQNVFYFYYYRIGTHFCFHRGFGIPPKGLPQQALACEGTSKISVAGTAENRDFFTERVPLSYACYSSYSLISTTTESCFLPNSVKKSVASKLQHFFQNAHSKA